MARAALRRGRPRAASSGAKARAHPPHALRGDAAVPARNVGLDALRGLALVAMIAYHFCFDLRWFGLTHWDFEQDARWIAARSAILGSFLVIAGASLALAARRPDSGWRFARRLAQIAAAALLVSAASYIAFPQRYIWFGVLHAIVVALLLARPLVGHPRVAVPIGIALIAGGVLVTHPAFDNRALGWLGFMTHKPATEDYVPLFPWAGLVFIGVALGGFLRRRSQALAPLARLPRMLPLLGRHSLVVYLIHQPLLVGVLWLFTHR